MPFTAAAMDAEVERLREHLQRQLIAAATRALSEVEDKQGPAPTTPVVDNIRGRALDQVAWNGKIVFLIDPVPRAYADAIAHLRETAPIDPHHSDAKVFRDSFATLIGGIEGVITSLKPGEEVVILNRQPYDRRLEEAWSLQAPDGVFEPAAKWLRTKWGRVVDVRYTWIGTELTLIGVTALAGKAGNKSAVRHPCIQLQARVFQ